MAARDISIHALLAESDLRVVDGSKSSIISIHALLAESDLWDLMGDLSYDNFYPRSPCGERPFKTLRHCTIYLFLSTLSLRRATKREASESIGTLHFYPRSPCGERRNLILFPRSAPSISIHALLAESDGGSGVGSWPRVIFLSTLSLRRATCIGPLIFNVQPHFYPRSPCGERRALACSVGFAF